MHSSSKSVQFDLNLREQSPPAIPHDETANREERREDDDERKNRQRDRGRDGERRSRRRRDSSQDSATSDATIELPSRFDDLGRRKGDDPLADKLESILNGFLR